MTDHRKRVANAIRIAKGVHSKRLLQDQYPTQYMPNVGRQVMAGGGMAEKESYTAPDGTTEVPAVYDQLGNILVPAQKLVIEENYNPPKDEGYRQPLGERVKEGISKGFGERRLGMREEDQRRYDPTGLVQNMFAAPVDFALRAPGAVVGGLSAAGAGVYGKVSGVDETQTNKLQRDLRVLGDVGLMEAGNVRPKAPTDVSWVPRSGEVLPPEASNALRISREVKERPTIDMEGYSRTPEQLQAPVERLQAPAQEGVAVPERPALTLEATPEPQRAIEVPVETPLKAIEQPQTLEAPAAPAPKTLDDLRLAQTQAKQAFEDAKVAVRSDNKNPELRAQVAQRQKEVMAATKELEKAESNREPRPGVTPNAAPKVAEPEYVRPVSDFGLYSHAAEVAAKAKQAGRPEDLITWLKAQPGVKIEELESVGAVTPSGKFNPEFAGGVKTMTPKELSDIFNEKTPDPKIMRRTETKMVYPRDVQELADIAIENPRVWDYYFGFTLGTHRDFNQEGLRTALESEEGQRSLSEVFNYTHGKIEVPGGAIYGPSSYEGYTTRGGKNYEEIPIYLEPTPENPPVYYRITGALGFDKKFATGQEASDYLEDIRARSVAMFPDDPEMREVIEQQLRRSGVIEEIDPDYRSPNLTEFGHMKDVPNNIAWIRKTEHDSPYGGVAYRVEESQSDLAQRGRDKGFNMSPEEVETAKAKIEHIESQIDDLGKKWVQYYDDSVEKGTYNTPEYLKDEKKFLKEQDKLTTIQDRIRRHIANSEQGISFPNFPYVKETQQWTDLTVKRALIDAANGGFDSVQFIKGDTNRERYPGDNSRDKEPDVGYHYDVNIPSSLSRVLKAIDPSAKVETIKVEPTIDHATSLLINRIKDRNADIEERMKTHQAYLNRLDASSREYGVAESVMSDYEQSLFEGNAALKKLTAPLELWSVRITPKLQIAIKKGLPKFKDGGAVNPGAIRNMTVDDLQKALMG